LAAHPSDREIHRARSLPGSRAVVGGALMAVAAIGVFVAYTDATDAPTTSFVVAAGAIRSGEVIEASDLRRVEGTVPEVLRDRIIADPSALVGRAALGPITDGDLVQAGMVSDDAGAGHEVAMVLPRSQVAVGRLKQGERVDLFVTVDDRTTSVVRGAPVVQIDAGGDGTLTTERELTLVVSVTDGDAVVALVHALRTGDVTVVRSTFSELVVDRPLEFTGPGATADIDTGEPAPEEGLDER
jgi:hypothetical protein